MLYYNNNNRIQRIEQEIKKGISYILQYKINNLCVNTIITITNVKVSRDLSYAKILVTFFDKKNNTLNETKKNILMLQSLSRYIRGKLNKYIYLRIMPKIFFFMTIQ